MKNIQKIAEKIYASKPVDVNSLLRRIRDNLKKLQLFDNFKFYSKNYEGNPGLYATKTVKGEHTYSFNISVSKSTKTDYFTLEFQGILIDPEQRNTGIGSKMVGAVEQAIIEGGYKNFHSVVSDPFNEPFLIKLKREFPRLNWSSVYDDIEEDYETRLMETNHEEYQKRLEKRVRRELRRELGIPEKLEK